MVVELSIGEAMKRARKKRGIKAYELAEMTGYNHCVISAWENDRAIPKLTTVIDVADALGISIDELIGHEVKK